MLPTYLALLAFAVFSLLVAGAMVFASKLLGPDEEHNPVKDLNYESAEEPIGRETSAMKEYLHYLTIFLAFELSVVILLLWTATAKQVGVEQSIVISAIPIFSAVLAWLGIAISRVKANE
ncbi:MAG: NADH-quinone oxidoreductase subunit A [Candidatus Micrarchaeia archaeon]|jgi:NADH:ubiquinone oxidoreductase subunit 3 (subunit A)